MWTNEKYRARYDRRPFRAIPATSPTTNGQLVEPLIPPGRARRRQTHSDHRREVVEWPYVYSLHRLSVAGHPERPAAALDVVRLKISTLWSVWIARSRSHTS